MIDVDGGQQEIEVLRVWDNSIINFKRGQIVRSDGFLESDGFCSECFIRLFDSSELNISTEAIVGNLFDDEDEAIASLGESILNVHDTSLWGGILAGDSSTVNLFGASIGTEGHAGMEAQGNSVVNIYDANIRSSEYSVGVRAHDSSTINVYGGSFTGFNDGGDPRSSLAFYDSSTVNFYGGSDYKVIAGGGTANFFGLDLEFVDGVVTGTSADGIDFNVSIVFAGEPARARVVLHEIPEPSSLTLAFVGLFILVRRVFHVPTWRC